MVEVTPTFTTAVTALSVFDEVAGEFCVDKDRKPIKNRSFKKGKAPKFHCVRDDAYPYAARISITGKGDNGKSHQQSYELDKTSNPIEFPKDSLVDRIRNHPEFKELAAAIKESR